MNPPKASHSPTIKTAVILAAGLGSRLKECGQETPKGFLCLGAQPIIVESLLRLRKVGIKRVIIVTGHLCAFYENLKKDFPEIETIHNPIYAKSGSLYSLMLTKDSINEDFLLLESDLIYETCGLEECLNFPQDNVILLSSPTHSGDEVYVYSEQQKLNAMSKTKSDLPGSSSGEFVGISKISQKLFQMLIEKMSPQLALNPQLHYETNGLVQVASQIAIYVHKVEGLKWAEIDDEAHFKRAHETIYPKLDRFAEMIS